MRLEKSIGIDFDNTLVRYSEVFLAAARERGLVPEGFRGGKQAIREAIRELPYGELTWQELQGYVYGIGINEAVLFDGVDGFLRRCRREICTVWIVSHKSEYGHSDVDQVNLRQAALAWMAARSFFRDSTYGIPINHVFFEATRDDKLARIGTLNCTHFIDDLTEVLLDPSFPPEVDRILFSEDGSGRSARYTVCRSWRDIENQVFGDGG